MGIQVFLSREATRVKRKFFGWSLIPAVAIVYYFLFMLPTHMRPVYEMTHQYAVSLGISEMWMSIMSYSVLHLVLFVTANLMMQVIYHLELPFFEQYKSSSDPWPWNANPEQWAETWKKIALTVVFNICILSPVAYTIDVFVTG
jgi:sterol desaturase/sphingolipid hydroxylase (fatty acid hydroxylase superfamily)